MGVPIASVVVGTCGGKAYYLYGGATPDGLALNAPKGLLWFAVQQEYGNGVREFNLGGMSATADRPDSLDHGLYKFKTGFGASQRSCISGRKVLRPVVVKLHAQLHAAVQSLRY
jgi:lipid II:glycine glycyltransferase (peptidoglycan interpeptide bridge formation enzyme)